MGWFCFYKQKCIYSKYYYKIRKCFLKLWTLSSKYQWRCDRDHVACRYNCSVEKGKSLVQKVFGPKFHRKFPAKRIKKTDSCPEGVWPTTSNGAYKTTGVNIACGEGQKVITFISELNMCTNGYTTYTTI